MSLRLLIDEDSQAKALVSLLRSAGHDLLTVNEAGLEGEPDHLVLDFAREVDRIVLTRNCDDFRALHRANPRHPGILGVYEEQNASKRITYAEIVRAMSNLEASG